MNNDNDNDVNDNRSAGGTAAQQTTNNQGGSMGGMSRFFKNPFGGGDNEQRKLLEKMRSDALDAWVNGGPPDEIKHRKIAKERILKAWMEESGILDLSNLNLTSLPPEIGQLNKLNQLLLGGNWIKELPGTLGNLTNLEVLDLTYNQLSALPVTKGQFPKLQVLKLGHNKFKDRPYEIGLLKNLISLDLSHNQLIGIPRTFGNLKELEILNLAFNDLVSLPAEIGDLIHLYSLSVASNNIHVLPATILNIKECAIGINNNPVAIERWGDYLLYVNDPNLNLNNEIRNWASQTPDGNLSVRGITLKDAELHVSPTLKTLYEDWTPSSDGVGEPPDPHAEKQEKQLGMLISKVKNMEDYWIPNRRPALEKRVVSILEVIKTNEELRNDCLKLAAKIYEEPNELSPEQGLWSLEAQMMPILIKRGQYTNAQLLTKLEQRFEESVLERCAAIAFALHPVDKKNRDASEEKKEFLAAVAKAMTQSNTATNQSTSKTNIMVDRTIQLLAALKADDANLAGEIINEIREDLDAHVIKEVNRIGARAANDVNVHHVLNNLTATAADAKGEWPTLPLHIAHETAWGKYVGTSEKYNDVIGAFGDLAPVGTSMTKCDKAFNEYFQGKNKGEPQDKLDRALDDALETAPEVEDQEEQKEINKDWSDNVKFTKAIKDYYIYMQKDPLIAPSTQTYSLDNAYVEAVTEHNRDKKNVQETLLKAMNEAKWAKTAKEYLTATKLLKETFNLGDQYIHIKLSTPAENSTPTVTWLGSDPQDGTPYYSLADKNSLAGNKEGKKISKIFSGGPAPAGVKHGAKVTLAVDGDGKITNVKAASLDQSSQLTQGRKQGGRN